jgi:integrase
MIDRIFKPAGSRIYRWRFRQQPEDGKILDVSLGTSELRVAEKRRTERRSEIQLERAGLTPPKTMQEAAQRNLLAHLEDFLGDMRRRGKSEKYLANLEFRVGKLVADCDWKAAINVTPDSFQAWLRGHPDLSAKTSNDYLEAVRCFFNWLIKNGRFSINPLLTVEKVRTEGRQTRERRAFTGDEFKRLLVVAGEHKTAYLMAAHTGLRRSELAQLKWADLRLEETKPFVLVRASTTKNGKVAPMCLHPELAAALREHKGESHPEDLVFKRFPRIERFKRDLKKAQVAYQDALGRFADFHALRKTFGTNLAKAGVPRRTAMSLMRHSDGKLTDKIYTDENLLGTDTTIETLPAFMAPASPIASLNLVTTSHNSSSGVTTDSGSEMEQSVASMGDSHDVTPLVTSGHNVEAWRERRGSNP